MAEETDKSRDLKKEIEKSIKMFDVAKPGATPPSATSRPIIIRHNQTLQKDPMVRDEKPEESSEKESLPAQSHKQRVILPPSQKTPEKVEEKPAPAEDKTPAPSVDLVKEEPKPEVPKEPLPKSEPIPEPIEEPVKEEPPEGKPETASSAVVDSLTEEVSSKRQKQKDQEAEAAKSAELQKLMESKEFYVKIGEAQRRRSYFQLVLLLVIIFFLAGLNFAADAEMLEIGVEPLTNLL